jgi:hypothetical protein
MTIFDAAKALSEGNPGALTAILKCATSPKECALFLGLLDELGIYGPRIYILCRYVALDWPPVFLALLCAAKDELAGMSVQRLNDAIDTAAAGGDHGIDLDFVVTEVVIHEMNRSVG